MPAGISRRVGVSVPENGGVVPTSPYPTTYFPGTTVAAKATTITVARAKVTANISFAVAAPRAVHRIKVSVRRAGGAPAERAAVDIKIPSANRSIGGITDAQGDLEFDEFAG